jgi:type I restriction enzyme S subunit
VIEWTNTTVADLVSEGVLERPMDGNHGAIHPKTSDFVEDGIPFIMASDMKNNRVDLENCSHISGAQARSLRKGFAKTGDVLLSHKATIGRTAIVGEIGTPFIMLTPQVTYYRILRPEVLDRRYLSYYFRSREFRHIFEQWAGAGSTRAYIGITDQKRLPIRFPDIATQRSIARFIGALDDKIELNRRMSATLEEMARALYRSWFVDFDPVHARALGQSPAHMTPTTAAIFPDSFSPDGLPNGWVREPLARHVTATRGLSYKGKHLCGPDDGVPLHNLNSILEGGGYKDGGAKYYNGDFKPRHEIRPGDLIVANTEQSFGLELIGHAALVPSWLGPFGIFSQHLYKVEIMDGSPLSKEWLYLALSIASLGVEIRGFSNGTTVNMLPADAFDIPEAIIPPESVVEKLNDFVQPAFAKQERLREEARTLASLRDTLLPRLMSGDLRILDAEKQIEEVV